MWKRIKIEFEFVWSLIRPLKRVKLKFKNKLKMAKALRLVNLKGVRKFHFDFAEDFYKMSEDERVDEYVNLIHTLVLVDHTPENGFTPFTTFNEKI